MDFHKLTGSSTVQKQDDILLEWLFRKLESASSESSKSGSSRL